MIKRLKNKITSFLQSEKDAPIIGGFICGLYPFLFLYSNNYPSINTWQHAGAFFLIYTLIPIVVIAGGFYFFKSIDKLRAYKKHYLFVAIIFVTSAAMSFAAYSTFKKKILLGILILAVLASIKLHAYYKRLLLIIIAMLLIPLFKCTVHVYEDMRPLNWTQNNDNIKDIRFKHTPNIYMIQPDGYVSKEIIEKKPYAYKNNFYTWLNTNKFTVYQYFRSNYPASLTSNASMFAMKHHYFDDFLFPAIEMPNARETIMNNNAIDIFNKNGYSTYYLAEDEYFQQNFSKGNYTHYNINVKDVPLFTKGEKLAREVYDDLVKVTQEKSSKPKFVFVEKVLPHHVHFSAHGDRKKAERKEYLENVEKANDWLKKAITTINVNDKDALIIILADHGGWVGIENMNELFSTKDESLIRSTFGNLAAIRWNKLDHTKYDAKLKSNVNVFRILFSCLADDPSYLNHLESDASYNIRLGGFTGSVYKLIDSNGSIVHDKHN